MIKDPNLYKVQEGDATMLLIASECGQKNFLVFFYVNYDSFFWHASTDRSANRLMQVLRTLRAFRCYPSRNKAGYFILQLYTKKLSKNELTE